MCVSKEVTIRKYKMHMKTEILLTSLGDKIALLMLSNDGGSSAVVSTA